MKTLIESGELSDAVKACDKLEHLLGQLPSYLNEAHVVIDLKVCEIWSLQNVRPKHLNSVNSAQPKHGLGNN